VGKGKPVPGQLKPLIAIPTTAGTGSETTGVSIFDLSEEHIKTGIAHRKLKPTLAIVDPDNTRTMPPLVAASTGLDVLCHALESYTALAFNKRERPERPSLRPAYQGSNPVSDIWAEQALLFSAKYLVREYNDINDEEARTHMILASSFAGMGFGNAGVHLCHGMSYPVCSMCRTYNPPGYPDDHPMVPHGIGVALTAPAVFRFTVKACSEKHLKAAEILGMKIDKAKSEDAGKMLSDYLIGLMQKFGLPNGLSAVGFTEADIPTLVKGTLPQHRVTKLSPQEAKEEDLAELFRESLSLW
jgi:hydroxyacid-oxoacid transhydrogenase